MGKSAIVFLSVMLVITESFFFFWFSGLILGNRPYHRLKDAFLGSSYLGASTELFPLSRSLTV
jgi:hypothetical protein